MLAQSKCLAWNAKPLSMTCRYKGWKATFKTGVYPFNALEAKGAKNDIVSSIVVQKVADEKMEMNTPPIPKAYENAIHTVSIRLLVSHGAGGSCVRCNLKLQAFAAKPRPSLKHGPSA